MRIINLDSLKECTSWGRQNENNATTLIVNIEDFLVTGDGKAVVFFQRQDGHPYIHNFVIDKENLFLTLNNTDT